LRREHTPGLSWTRTARRVDRLERVTLSQVSPGKASTPARSAGNETLPLARRSDMLVGRRRSLARGSIRAAGADRVSNRARLPRICRGSAS
jgi:hypothetical protein